MFDTIAGLPAHPLIVHLPVVLLPLAAIGLVLLAAVSSWRPRFALALLAILAVGTAGAVSAVVSGNALAETLGRPAAHATAGLNLAISAVVLLLVGGAWLIWVRKGDPTRAQNVGGWVSAAVGVVVLALTVIAGHSGATAAWAGVGTATPAASAEATTSTPTAEATATESSAPGYTMADVESHGTQDSCWAAIEGNVYDLTDWIGQHPGGASHIVALCGTDATSAFQSQHSGDARPADELAQFILGPLVS